MAVFITKKQSWIRFLAALLPGAGIGLLLFSFLSGPQLGPVYDFLLRQRSRVISPELLLIDTSNFSPSNLNSPGSVLPSSGIEETANILEPSAAASLLLTAAEMGASTIIIETPVLGLSAGSSASGDEIRYRFNEEFGVLSRNISSLFDAIRLGSISPLDAGSYVNELVDLSEQAKERLASALIRLDEEGLVRLERAERIFGEVRRPGDLLIRLIRSNDERSFISSVTPPETAEPHAGQVEINGDSSEYYRAKPDRDGVIRRIAPVLETGDKTDEGPVYHIVYGVLRDRYQSSRIEHTEEGIFLVNQGLPVNFGSGFSLNDQSIPLDSEGALIFDIPRPGEGFHKVHVKDFLDYDEAGRSLRRLLGEAESLGIYKDLEGEKNPVYLWDYALSLLDELLEDQSDENKFAWIKARAAFFDAADSFLFGPAEMNLVLDYEEIIASEDLDEEIRAYLENSRNKLILSFEELRQKHDEILELRNKLSALDGAFCILGPFPGGEPAGFRSELLRATAIFRKSRAEVPRMSDAEASALLANSLLTGRAIRPGPDMWLLAGAAISLLLTAFILRPLGTAPTVILGLFLSLFFGTVFVVGFFIFDIWLDPLVPAAAVASYTLFSFLWTLALKRRLSRSFKNCYGACISHSTLKSIIRAGRPRPNESLTVRAAVVAVRNPQLLVRGDLENPRAGAEAFLEFREKTASFFKQAGGTILAGEGDTVLACFGSPLERAALWEGSYSSPYEGNIKANEIPATRAADFVASLLKQGEGTSWQYGMDIGDCCFNWSPLSGYCGFGRPVIRAKILASLASRYEGRPLVTAAMTGSLPDLPFKKIAVLKNTDGTNGEAFYEFPL